jgi:hypothetical protein
MRRGLVAAMKNVGMNEAAEINNRTKAKWARQFPCVPFRAWSNGRFEVQVESALAAGLYVPDERIAEVTEHDLRYDGFAFPCLRERMAALTVNKA